MDKEKLKKTKALYYPYIVLKKVVNVSINYIHYISSLYYISRNKMRVQKKIDQKEVLNVVFVVQYIPSWNKLEPIYTKMKNDERFNPTIVCVPFNIQNHKLMDKNGNDTYEYFVKHGYEAINALKDEGSWYDLKQLNPDYVFHSRPYNYVMPKGYTSGKIVKYALICNVIYGTCLSENGLDVTLNFDYYKNTYTYFAFEIREKEFFESRFKLGVHTNIQKSLPYGATDLEQVLNQRREKSLFKYRKTIIWTPRWSTDRYVGGSNFFNYREEIMDLANVYQDVLFIIRPHPLMISNFINTGEMTLDEEKAFRAYCQEKPNIILDESKEYVDTFWGSDLLITDASGILPQYFITGKPILYCGTNINTLYTDWAEKMIGHCYLVNNTKDLKYYCSAIINGNDKKKAERDKYINTYFCDAMKNSTYIIESLLSKD